MLFLISFFLGKKNQGPTEIRTRITGFRVLGANHYTMGPTWKISFYITIIFWMLVSSLEEVSHDQLNVSSAVVAEWLRRLTRNQLRSPCTGSNPVNCAFFSFLCNCSFSLKKRFRKRGKLMWYQWNLKFTQSVGFEPTLPEGNWFLVSRLNHSATTAHIRKCFEIRLICILVTIILS